MFELVFLENDARIPADNGKLSGIFFEIPVGRSLDFNVRARFYASRAA